MGGGQAGVLSTAGSVFTQRAGGPAAGPAAAAPPHVS